MESDEINAFVKVAIKKMAEVGFFYPIMVIYSPNFLKRIINSNSCIKILIPPQAILIS
jgi:hypothetical protein